jgi:hypothetical protein
MLINKGSRRKYGLNHSSLSEKKYNRLDHQKRKIAVLNHYSQGTNTCAFCGISDIRVLSIDHVEGCNKEQREKCGHGGHFYWWLIKNNYPIGYQVLCMNCQWIKRHTRKETNSNTLNPRKNITQQLLSTSNDFISIGENNNCT